MSATAATAAVKTLSIDGREVPINGERNLLELIRKAGIDLPTFCYHSDLSVYGACRLCLVDIAGRGIQGACSTPPEPGLKIRTQTEEIREIRKISVELLLANHERECTTCGKSAACQLQDVARKLGIRKVRFKPVHEPKEVDRSSLSLVRDPNKCVLCGDCVRFCSEIQGIGAIDFAYRGHDAAVLPAFGKGSGRAANASTAASAPPCARPARSRRGRKWTRFGRRLNDPAKTVVAQIAPAVRVAIGELFGMPPGESTRGQMVAALKRLGFDRVYDTAFSADLTVIEEANEFLKPQDQGRQAAAVHELLPGLGEVRGTVFSGAAAESVHLQIAAADARRVVQGTAAGGTGREKGKPRHGFHHALHGQEIRGQAAGVRQGRHRGSGPRPHHAGTGADDRGGRIAVHEIGAGIVRHADGFQDRRGRDFRQFRRRERSRAALCLGKSHREKTGESGLSLRFAARTACASSRCRWTASL